MLLKENQQPLKPCRKELKKLAEEDGKKFVEVKGRIALKSLGGLKLTLTVALASATRDGCKMYCFIAFSVIL